MAHLAKRIGQWTLQNGQTMQFVAIRSGSCAYSTQSEKSSFKCVVLGGGTGGCAMAAKMTRKFGAGNVAVIEPQDVSLSFNIWQIFSSF